LSEIERGFGVNDNNPNTFRPNLAVFQPWLNILLVCWLLGSLGLGWLVKSALILVAVIIAVPVVLAIALFVWLRANLVQSACPVCGFEPLQTINGQKLQCPSCGEELTAAAGKLLRTTPPDTIDVVAVEVDSN
jgi:amino acid transporter